MPAIAHQNKILGNTSGGGSTILVTTSESTLYGQTVTLSDGTTTLTGTFSNAGECEFTGVMMVGTLTASSGTASTSLNVPYFGVYTIILSLFSATITATYPDDKGATCTCTGNGESYTASGSPYTFTVHGAGEYRVTATLDGKSITLVRQITTDGQSETATIIFGTIVVTYDNAFRGQTITCTKDAAVYTKTAPSSGNTMYFYPNITGSWIVSGTVGGTPYSKTANVTSLSTSVSVSLETVPDGKTATPTDDIEKWLACGQITGKSYTTLSQVLADAETYERLLSDSNACDYMARSTTWASTICADADAMMRLGKYDYAYSTLLGVQAWAEAIASSSYSEYVLAYENGLVPKMTGNTSPSGEASASTWYSQYNIYPYMAFDGTVTNGDDCWQANTSGGQNWLQYEFPTARKVTFITIQDRNNSAAVVPMVSAKLQGSNDGQTFTDIATITRTGYGSPCYKTGHYINNSTAYKIYRLADIVCTHSGTTPYFATIGNLQFFGEATKTDIIVTAHGGDTVYYMDNGQAVPLTTADSDTGIGTVDWSDLPKGAITLYSSTAKNPSDLTADYSKTVYVNENTTQIYLMPYEPMLYWFGYESADLEDITSANGWSSQVNGTVTRNYTSIYLSNFGGIGNKNVISAETAHAIMESTSLVSVGIGVKLMNSKDPQVGTVTNQEVANTIQHLTYTDGNTYSYVAVNSTNASRAGNVYALWYE